MQCEIYLNQLYFSRDRMTEPPLSNIRVCSCPRNAAMKCSQSVKINHVLTAVLFVSQLITFNTRGKKIFISDVQMKVANQLHSVCEKQRLESKITFKSSLHSVFGSWHLLSLFENKRAVSFLPSNNCSGCAVPSAGHHYTLFPSWLNMQWADKH